MRSVGSVIQVNDTIVIHSKSGAVLATLKDDGSDFKKLSNGMLTASLPENLQIRQADKQLQAIKKIDEDIKSKGQSKPTIIT